MPTFQIPKIYYRENGVRYSDRLINPPNFRLTVFPQNALFHYVPHESGSPEVEPAMPYFQGYPRKISLDYIFKYTEETGPVRRPPANVREITRPFRQANRQNWVIADGARFLEHNPKALVVVNYGYLETLYRYVETQMTAYYRWSNQIRTIYATMNEIAEKSDRQQFLFYPIPALLHGKTILDKYARDPMSLQAAKIIGSHDPAGFWQFDFWKWLHPDWRKDSFLGKINPKHYGKINLIFKSVTGKELLVNLSYFNAWIKGQPNETELPSIIQFDHLIVQKLFLKMCMALNQLAISGELAESGEVPQTEARRAPVTVITPTPKTGYEPSDAPDDADDAEDSTQLTPAESVTEPVESPETEEELTDAAVDEERAQLAALAEKVKAPLTTPVEAKMPDLTRSLLKELEGDIAALDRISLVQLKNRGEKLTAEAPADEVEVIDPAVVHAKIFTPEAPAERFKKILSEDAEANLLTASDYRKLQQMIATYEASEDPYGGKLPRMKAMVIHPEDLTLPASLTEIVTTDAVPDKSMGKSSLKAYDAQYLNKVYRKDILRAVDAVQSTGVAIRRHEVNITHSALGTYEQHTLELKPIDGAPSTISFTLPQVAEDGTFLSGGNRYIYRKQRVDLPIRKIAPQIVALSTYYGKTFVQTSPKVSNSSLSQLFREINLSSLSQNGLIRGLSPGDVFNNDLKTPYIYGALSHAYASFFIGTSEFVFDYEKRTERVDPAALAKLERNGRVWCGVTAKGAPIVATPENTFVEVTPTGEVSLGNIYELLELKEETMPVDFAEVRVFSKYLPVGVVLGYYVGFKALVALLKARYRIVPGRKNKALKPDEYAIVFKDESWIFSRRQKVASLILAGYNEFEKSLKSFDRVEFEKKDVYLNLFFTKKYTSIYVRELDMLQSAFVDPISREILESLHEPQTFMGLLVRSVELLTSYSHPASQDRSAMRDRGYERFAGVVYKELMQSVRQFRNQNLVGRSKISMSPYQVWNTIMKDNSIKIVEDINPIQNLKESEVFTYAGIGGRDKDTMTKPTRAYHPSDIGVTSESTVDNAGVGTIAYLSADPNLSGVRGLMSKDKALSPTNMMSTSALLSPGSSNDGPKRIMFISTQHSHTIASSAYRQPYLRTGYESVIGKRTGKLFSTAAEENGKVIEKNERGIIVQYQSGKEVGIDLGRQYGKAEGTVYPHDVYSPLSAGDRFKAGDILAYNTKFFEPDFLDPSNTVLKMNDAVTVAMIESNKTHEDSCTISPTLGARFETEVTKIKSYVVSFAQNLLEVKKPGERVAPKDVLMIIEDEITGGQGQFNDASYATLRRIAKSAPKAGVLGVVEKIEVFYNGDKADMSPTLKRLADRSDSEMASAAKASRRPIVTGKVTEEYRVSGTPLEIDQAEVRLYLTVTARTGVGDKAVVANQMKCTISEVHQGELRTEHGEVVDATFSYRSVLARGVLSPALMGTTIRLLDAASRQAADLYFGDAPR